MGAKMKAAFFIISIFLSANLVFSQRNVKQTIHYTIEKNLIDSLKKELLIEKSDTSKAKILYGISYAYHIFRPDSALMFAQQSYSLSKDAGFLKGQSWALNQMASAFKEMGNITKALELYLEQLKIEEKRHEPGNIATINMNIASIYNKSAESDKAVFFILKADSIINANNVDYLKLFLLLNKGDIFEKANRLEEAEALTDSCLNMATKLSDTLMMGSAFNNLGNIYSKKGEYEKAISFYNASLPLLSTVNDMQSIFEGRLEVAKIYNNGNKTDSALVSAMQAYHIAKNGGFLKKSIQASQLLTKIFRKQHQLDSAFYYEDITTMLKDSVESDEKIKLLESMTINEQLRQIQIAHLAEKERQEKKSKMQLLIIGISIPLIVLISFYISRKSVPGKVVKFFGIISLLLFFEYLNLFLHPFAQKISHHTPIIELLILVLVASMLIPLHHRIEHWFLKHLTTIHEYSAKKLAIKKEEERLKELAKKEAERLKELAQKEAEDAAAKNSEKPKA